MKTYLDKNIRGLLNSFTIHPTFYIFNLLAPLLFSSLVTISATREKSDKSKDLTPIIGYCLKKNVEEFLNQYRKT